MKGEKVKYLSSIWKFTRSLFFSPEHVFADEIRNYVDDGSPDE